MEVTDTNARDSPGNRLMFFFVAKLFGVMIILLLNCSDCRYSCCLIVCLSVIRCQLFPPSSSVDSTANGGMTLSVIIGRICMIGGMHDNYVVHLFVIVGTPLTLRLQCELENYILTQRLLLLYYW